ncbi:MAG TPA: 5'-nucleotidase C-terminal domain-containing protein [Tissierellaceae bacterium]|nr:5'-nucleotidase C-terminal domain-containing protein [Tissierellaceae bacterium]
MFKRNRKFMGLVLALLMVFTIVLPSMTFADAEEMTITVLGTTDVHGNIYNWSYEDGKEIDNKGFAKLYSIVKEIREENPNTILLDNGDTIQGTILTDEVYKADKAEKNPMIDVMNFMKYDAMILGNHEFNFGLDAIDKLIEQADFPILSSNIYNKEDGTSYVAAHHIIEMAGIKIGVIGFTTPNIPRWDGEKVESLEFEAMDKAAEKHIKALKEEEVDVIVAVGHASLDIEYAQGDEMRTVIENHPEIDLALIGHEHVSVAEIIGTTAVGGARDAGKEIVRFDLKLKKEDGKWTVLDRDVKLIEVIEYEASEELKEYAREYHETTLEYIAQEIGTATGDFHPKSEIKGIPEGRIRDTAVMDLINQVQLEATGADVSAAALFSSTSNIEEGPITYADIFDIYKFPNTLKMLEVTGKELKDYMEWSVKYYNTFKPGDINISFNPEVRDYLYDMFAGVDYKIDLSKAAGERITYLKFEGEDVKPDDTLNLVVNDYRLSGLKNEGILSGDPIFETDPVSSRELISKHIEELETIEPQVDNNWEIIGVDLEHPLRDYLINEINEGRIELPTSEDGRTINVKGLNVYELIEEGLIPDEVLEEHGIDLGELEPTPEPEPEEIPGEVEPEPTPEIKEYIVKKGDVLYRIGIKYGIDWKILGEFNNLANPHLIYPGQIIKIP